MKKCSKRYFRGPKAISRSPAMDFCGSSHRASTAASTTSSAPAGHAPKQAGMRASNSRGEKGLVTVVVRSALEATDLVLFLAAGVK